MAELSGGHEGGEAIIIGGVHTEGAGLQEKTHVPGVARGSSIAQMRKRRAIGRKRQPFAQAQFFRDLLDFVGARLGRVHGLFEVLAVFSLASAQRGVQHDGRVLRRRQEVPGKDSQ